MKDEKLEIINYYGIRKQLKKLSEEVYEFQEAILMDDSGEEALEHIVEEYADVELILEQFKEYYELNNEDIAEMKVKKAMRTLERIEEKCLD